MSDQLATALVTGAVAAIASVASWLGGRRRGEADARKVGIEGAAVESTAYLAWANRFETSLEGERVARRAVEAELISERHARLLMESELRSRIEMLEAALRKAGIDPGALAVRP